MTTIPIGTTFYSSDPDKPIIVIGDCEDSPCEHQQPVVQLKKSLFFGKPTINYQGSLATERFPMILGHLYHPHTEKQFQEIVRTFGEYAKKELGVPRLMQPNKLELSAEH